MYRICLINMPFAALYLPSLALTQLKAITEESLGDQVRVDICYLNHDFAKFLGNNVYNLISTSLDAHTTGIGDWLFRQSAFSGLTDNSEDYFKRYYPHRNQQTQGLKDLVNDIRGRLNDHFDDVIKKYGMDEADLVGFTSMFTQNVSCFALADRIKKRNPKAVIVMGGANCESPMGQEIVKNVPAIDFVFAGPALKSFPQFVRRQIAGEVNKCHSIQGVFSKRNCALTPLGCGGAAGEELPIDVEVKLDYQPFLRLVEENFPNKEVSPVLLFETSRGCWWGEKSHCTFCGLNGSSMNYRSMSSEKAIAQFRELFKYTDVCKRLESVDNILPKHYLKEVLPNINTPPNVEIFYEVKADLSEEDMQVLSKSRVSMIQPGIESLATSTLKLMRKGTNAFVNLFLLKNCVSYSIFPAWNLLIGFPGEGEDVYKKYLIDLPLLIHLPPPSGVYPVRFDRYSPYFVQSDQYKLDLRPLDYYSLTYPFAKDALANMAYYFSDANLTATYFITMARWIGKIKEKIEGWKGRWFNPDPEKRPRLYFKSNGGAPVVFDSRSGDPVEYKISETSHQLLEFLNKPRRIPDIVTKMAAVSGFNAESEIACLQEKGLIFQEGERYMNIVLPNEAPLTIS